MKKPIKLDVTRTAQRMARERGQELNSTLATRDAQQKRIGALERKIQNLERRLHVLENKLSHTEALLNRVNTTMNTNFRRLHPNTTILEVT